MQLTFLVNDPTDIQPSQTTAMLIQAALRQGHSVGVTGVQDLQCNREGHPSGRLRQLAANDAKLSLLELMQRVASSEPADQPLSAADVLFMRTNPARDMAQAAAHSFAISLSRLCQDKGTRVVNQPDGLIRAATKLYLMELPAFTRPDTLVSQNPADILSFIRSLDGPAVLKPVQGTRGSDVFLIHAFPEPNLNQIIDVILRQGPVMAQRCIPGAAAGDTRVVVLNGQVLEINNKPAAIQRVPKPGDFRSNIHAGGSAQPAVVTAAMRDVVAAIGPKLVRDGLFLVGLDFIGAQLVELNVFSTGGLRDAQKFTGEDFSARCIAALAGGNPRF